MRASEKGSPAELPADTKLGGLGRAIKLHQTLSVKEINVFTDGNSTGIFCVKYFCWIWILCSLEAPSGLIVQYLRVAVSMDIWLVT